MADDYDCLDFLHPVHRFSPSHPYIFLHPDPDLPPVLSRDLTRQRSPTPELQYPVSLIAIPDIQATLEAAHVLAHNQHPLHILSNAAFLIHSAPVSPTSSNTLGLNEVAIPSLQEGPSVDDETLLLSSLSYHVQSPTLSRSQVFDQGQISPPGPCPSPANPCPPSPPNQKEARLNNQENCPPTSLASLSLDPYAPPACAQFVHPYHLHQFLILQHEDQDI